MSTHGNGYGDIEIGNAINDGRIDGPRYQVSTRGIVLGDSPDNPLAAAIVRNAEDARAAVRDRIAHGADWIKLYPAGAYSFDASGVAHYVVTYPLPVLQALIDETHRLGKKTACHVYGGEGQRNAIVAGLYYDPTLVRYMEPYIDDVDAKNTGGRFRIIPIFERAARMAAAIKRIEAMMGRGVDGSTLRTARKASNSKRW